MATLQKKMEVLLADTYALYLKTQNYHWHVKGPQFKALHELFEMQYQALAEAVDEIAERILILGHQAPATFAEFDKLKTIKDGNSKSKANQMVKELAKDNASLVSDLNQVLSLAQATKDEGTANLIAERIAAHEKAAWMLRSSEE